MKVDIPTILSFPNNNMCIFWCDKQLEGTVSVVTVIHVYIMQFIVCWQDEFSFVSLRDVERVLEVMSWFYAQTQGQSSLFSLMDGENHDEHCEEDDNDEEEYEDTAEEVHVLVHIWIKDDYKAIVIQGK